MTKEESFLGRLKAMRNYAVALMFLLVASACSGGAETVAPVVTTTPVVAIAAVNESDLAM